MNRRSLVCFAGAASCIGLPAPSFAQDRKPIRLIVPFPAGGPTDVVARLLTDPLGKRLGQSVFVDNRPGSGGAAGTVELARSNPDGLTLGIASVSTHAVNPAVKRKAEYDPLKDFAAIIELVKAPVALVVHPALGINPDFPLGAPSSLSGCSRIGFGHFPASSLQIAELFDASVSQKLTQNRSRAHPAS